LPHQWDEAIQEWVLQIRDRVGADVYKLLVCNFSTTTPTILTASHVVMMDTFQKYFKYHIRYSCGIPNLTLLGTVEDWQSIYDRVQNMTQYNLKCWTDRLLPICQEFVNVAAGKPSLEFWRCIYRPEKVYAADYITGWLVDLFPYLQDPITQAPTVRNELLDLNHSELPLIDSVNGFISRLRSGIQLHSLPLGLSKVPCEAKGTAKHKFDLVAGFIGVHQDPEQGILQPEIGWAVHKQTDPKRKSLKQIQQDYYLY
jgi:Domain of unknown function (DUF4419)